MPTVFRKLNFKDQAEIVVLNAPQSFEPELEKLAGVRVRRKLPNAGALEFVLTFVTRQSEIDAVAPRITELADGDAVVWFAYPKGSSKRYQSEIHRDSGWNALGAGGFEPVRMVAIDEDWSAVRFRRADFIKTMKRDASYAISARGKELAARSRPRRKR